MAITSKMPWKKNSKDNRDGDGEKAISNQPSEMTTSKEEGQGSYHVDHPLPDESMNDWDEAEERKLVRKIDLRILPFLSLVYGLSLLDRSNISAAYIAGMDKGLELNVGARYNIALMMFFVPYTLFELPSNLIIRRLGARTWLTFLIIGFGSVVLGMGLVHHWVPLTVLRAFLGAFEAGLLPGSIFLLSSWYKTFESGKRFTIFYMSALLANGFNGIIAYALSLIRAGNGTYREGWRWIFIVEGAVTIVFGFVSPWFLGEFPEKSLWLSERQRYIARQRLASESGGAAYEDLPLMQSLKSLLDWKVAFYCFQLYVAAASVYALAYFMPVILRQDMGFSYTKAQLLTSPPYLMTVILSIASAWLSDRTKLRWPFLCSHAVITICGLLLMLYVKSPGVRYFGTFLAVFGTQANTPGSLAYATNQIGDPRKKGVVVAAMVSFASMGGITGSNVFRSQDAPTYFPGMWTMIALQIAYTVGTFVMSKYLANRNRMADEAKISDTLEGVAGFRYAP